MKQNEIKGGIRYFTNSHLDFRKKKAELNSKRIAFLEQENDGIFCIEW